MVISQKSLRLLLLVLPTVTGTCWQDPGAGTGGEQEGGVETAAVAHLAHCRYLEERPPIPVFMAGASARAGEMQLL